MLGSTADIDMAQAMADNRRYQMDDTLFVRFYEETMQDIAATEREGRPIFGEVEMIEIMQPGIARDDQDYHAAQVMNFVLGSSGFGSRLTEEIREKQGLTYGIYSSFYNLDQLAAMSVSTSTKNENVSKMLAAIHNEFTKMRDEGVSQKELDDAKSYLIGSLPLSLTSTDKISGLMLSLMRDDLPINYLDTREKAIQNMTLEDISNIAKRLLSPAEFVTVLTGQPPIDTLEWLGDITVIETLPNVE